MDDNLTGGTAFFNPKYLRKHERLNRFEDLKGHYITELRVIKDAGGYGLGSEILFQVDNVAGVYYRLYHEQDCRESVYIEDICGDLTDLVDYEVLLAECVTNEGEAGGDSATWTFYKLATMRGAVTIRWFGTSNGHYSESVDWGVVKVTNERP